MPFSALVGTPIRLCVAPTATSAHLATATALPAAFWHDPLPMQTCDRRTGHPHRRIQTTMMMMASPSGRWCFLPARPFTISTSPPHTVLSCRALSKQRKSWTIIRSPSRRRQSMVLQMCPRTRAYYKTHPIAH